jgi:catechol 2,3-dioxygenase-like lactoylglutathione lyase family enzyme
MIMEGFVAHKLAEFERGKISRRRLIETLTLAATTAYAADRAGAAEQPGLKAALINHISYTCPNYRQAADWYSKVFNLDQIGARDRDVALPFGKKGEQPYNVAAKDVPLTHLIFRTRDLNPAPAAGEAPRPKVQAVIDHVAYTVADFDREKAKAELKSLGVENVRDGGLYSLHMTDPFGYDVQVSGLANNALTDG